MPFALQCNYTKCTIPTRILRPTKKTRKLYSTHSFHRLKVLELNVFCGISNTYEIIKTVGRIFFIGSDTESSIKDIIGVTGTQLQALLIKKKSPFSAKRARQKLKLSRGAFRQSNRVCVVSKNRCLPCRKLQRFFNFINN